MGSNSDVSAFFRLRFRNGLGTKPAGVLPFRMRVPNTFFLSLAWWLAGFQVLRCVKVCLAWGDFFSLFLVGSKSNVSAVFWLRFRMVWALFLAAVSHGLGIISFFLMGSNSDVSAFFRLRFRNGLGTKPAARPKHLFLEFGLVAWATFRHFSGCGFAMAWAQNLLGFCLFARASQTPFSWVWPGGLQASKSYVAQRFALLEATFFFVFSRFQKQRFALSLFGIFRRFHKQRFGSFLAAVSHGLGIYIYIYLSF